MAGTCKGQRLHADDRFIEIVTNLAEQSCAKGFVHLHDNDKIMNNERNFQNSMWAMTINCESTLPGLIHTHNVPAPTLKH